MDWGRCLKYQAGVGVDQINLIVVRFAGGIAQSDVQAQAIGSDPFDLVKLNGRVSECLDRQIAANLLNRAAHVGCLSAKRIDLHAGEA